VGNELRPLFPHLTLLNSLAIHPKSPMFPNWVDYPVPIVNKFYVFNVTNAEEVQKNGAIPSVVEVEFIVKTTN